MDAKVLKFFELYGVHYQIYDRKLSKNIQKFVLMFWLFSYGFHFCSSILRFFGVTKNHFPERDYIIQFGVCVTSQVFGFIVFIFTLKKRKKDLKMLRNLREVDELMESFLKLKLQNSFNTSAFYKVAIQFSILSALIIFMQLNQKNLYKYPTKELPVPDVGILTTGMYITKYIFYADLMSMRLKVIQKGFYNFKLFFYSFSDKISTK